MEDLVPDAGKLWGPNQGVLRDSNSATDGILQEVAAMIIMTVSYLHGSTVQPITARVASARIPTMSSKVCSSVTMGGANA